MSFELYKPIGGKLGGKNQSRDQFRDIPAQFSPRGTQFSALFVKSSVFVTHCILL